MTSDIVAYSLSRHPSPHRDRIGLKALLYGIFVAPIAWSGCLMADFALVSHVCYPGEFPRSAPPGLTWIWWVVLALDIVALALIASGFLLSRRNWRVTGPPEGHEHRLMQVGEGRSRFISVVGMAFSVMFFLITMTQTIALAFLPLCSH